MRSIKSLAYIIKSVAQVLILFVLTHSVYAGIPISNYGALVGQCEAIYDLNLITDEDAKSYTRKIINAWNMSDKKTRGEYNASYLKTRRNLEDVRRLSGAKVASGFSQDMHLTCMMVIDDGTDIKDLKKSGQRILRSAQNARDKEYKEYNSKRFTDDELDRSKGWYMPLIQCMDNFSYESVADYYNSHVLMQRHPVKMCVGSIYSYGLLLGPFASLQDAQDYYERNSYDFRSVKDKPKFVRYDRAPRVAWSNEIKGNISSPGSIHESPQIPPRSQIQ